MKVANFGCHLEMVITKDSGQIQLVTGAKMLVLLYSVYIQFSCFNHKRHDFITKGMILSQKA